MGKVDFGGKRDPRVRHFLQPERVVWHQNADQPEALLQPGGQCRLKCDGEAASLLLDFGREIHGSIRLRNGQHAPHRPTPVRIRFGESVAEVMGQPNQDHAIHDQEVLIPWYGASEFGTTGFRFVRIDLEEPGSELAIVELTAVFLFHDLEYRGAFRCNDERLNEIWRTGAYTVHLCMQDMLWDGIKRDRLVWIGDMHPETTVVSMVFGDHEIVPESLDFVRDDTPLPEWMNGISSYSMWWVLIQHGWYLFHGNRAYLAEQGDYLEPLMHQLLKQVGPHGREQVGGHRFLDWPSSGDEEAIHGGLQALLTLTLEAGGELCQVLGREAIAAECAKGAAALRQYASPPVASKVANALLVLGGYADAHKTNQQVLAQDPLRNVSTFYGYYVLQARAKAGDYAGAMDVIRRFWGAMLDLGATTFWEDFHWDWIKEPVSGVAEIPKPGQKNIHADFGDYCYKGLRHSLCHGWAAGPTAWLSEHVLGLRPLAPGCAKMALEPHLAGLDFAEGRFPTPKGDIEVRHTRQDDGSVATECNAPEGIEIVRKDGTA